MNTNNNYNGTNKRSIEAFKAENGNAKFNIIPSTSGKTYQNSTTGMLFFSCGATTGYVTKKAAEKILNAENAEARIQATMDCLVVDHEVTNKETGKVETLACLEVDSPNALLSI